MGSRRACECLQDFGAATSGTWGDAPHQDNLDYPTASSELGVVGFLKGGTAFTQDKIQGCTEFAIAKPSDGTFSTSLDVAGLPAGTYTVEAEAAYATTSDLEVGTFTIE